MIKVLHIINGMGTGGAEKDIMNWYRNINRSEVQFDFLIRSDEDFYREEIESYGGKLIQVPSFPRHLLSNYIETWCFFKNHKYDVIHVHGNALVYIVPLIIGKHFNVPTRIFHAHNTRANGKLASLIHRINRLIVRRFATDLLACSKAAGEFSYGKSDFIVINNAIDLDRYCSHSDCIRQELNILEDIFVVGHIGRFMPVKNHVFLVDIFEKLIEFKNDSRLILVGTGGGIGEIKDCIHNKRLDAYVSFLGERNDVEDILDCFDVMVFPSLYEGVPLVVLEAQANGTKILCSSVIDPDVLITPFVRMKDLNDSTTSWAQAVCDFAADSISCDIYEQFDKCGYTLEKVMDKLYKIYAVKSP